MLRLIKYCIALILFSACSVVHQNGMHQSRKYRVFKKKSFFNASHSASRKTAEKHHDFNFKVDLPENIVPAEIALRDTFEKNRTQDPVEPITLVPEKDSENYHLSILHSINSGPTLQDKKKMDEPEPIVHPALDLGIVFGLSSVLSLFMLIVLSNSAWPLAIPVMGFLILGCIGLCIALLTKAFQDSRSEPGKYAYQSFTLLALITSYFYAAGYLAIVLVFLLW